MGRSSPALVHIGGRAVGALPRGLRRRVRAALGRPGPWPVALADLGAVLARATTLMGSDADGARALLDGFVLVLPTPPPDDPFSEVYTEWTWDLYRDISGRAR